MKRVWKWIIGIVIGLVILAVLVGGVLLVRNGFHAGREHMGYVSTMVAARTRNDAVWRFRL